jgi:hypothetical protein
MSFPSLMAAAAYCRDTATVNIPMIAMNNIIIEII